MCLPWSVVVLASAAVGRLQVRACEIAREDALFAAVRVLLGTGYHCQQGTHHQYLRSSSRAVVSGGSSFLIVEQNVSEVVRSTHGQRCCLGALPHLPSPPPPPMSTHPLLHAISHPVIQGSCIPPPKKA